MLKDKNNNMLLQTDIENLKNVNKGKNKIVKKIFFTSTS